MRTAFIRALLEAAEDDERVTLVVGDLGFGVVEPFAERFPERYVNVGVAEQNMTGVAAGMAMSAFMLQKSSVEIFSVFSNPTTVPFSPVNRIRSWIGIPFGLAMAPR